MKLSAIFLLLALQVSATNYAQEKINLKAKDVSLSEVFKAIENQSSYRFNYSNDILPTDKLISVNVVATDIKTVLNKMFEGIPLKWTIEKSNNIFLTPTSTETVVARVVTGNITNEKGEAIARASITIKGSVAGTLTAEDGSFTINANTGDVLVISAVGYASREVKIGEGPLHIVLTAEENKLDEVVIVGYGTQKKINVSGSVASVSGATLAKSPAPTFTNLLQGQVAGLSIVQPSGEPGRDVGSILIRGLGSYGSSSTPLILVDGIVSSISNLNPQDVENVSVLKDAASASIYGSRGANGVILITTKKGKSGKPTIEYNNSIGTTKATTLPKFITNSVTYMQMFNAARQRSGQPDIYTQDQISAYKNGAGTAQYPNTDWLAYYFHNGALNNHNLSLSGGSNMSNYYVSVGYQKQKGIMDLYGYNRYNSVIDYNTQVIKRVKVGTNINMSYQNMTAPNFTNDDIILLAYAQAPTFSPYLTDGSGRRANRDYVTNGVVNRTVDEVLNSGAQYTKNYNINAQGYVDVNIAKGLNWQTKGAFVFFNQDYQNISYPTATPSYAFQPDASGKYSVTGYGNPNFNGLRQSSTRDLTLTVNSVFNYAKDFGADHHVSSIAGYEQISNRSTNIGGARYNFISTSITQLNGGPTQGWTNSGGASEYALQSLFGRVNYNYQGKYFLEGDIRYDGTSRVDPKYRWGTFGGGSAAWRISEENFIKNNVSWISDLKLRASYGVLGNQEITDRNGNVINYAYQSVLTNTAYPFSGSLSTGAIVTALASTNLRWETTATTNLGFDLNIQNGLLGVTFDWYKKNTSGILAQQNDLPASLGLSAPIINAGAMENKGIELALTHQNHIGEFTYGANFLIAFNHNKVTKVIAPNKGVFEVGLPYNSHYIYQWDGIFQSQDEITKSPAQPNSGNLKPGDLKIKDVTGDSKITPDDRISISPYADYSYSFGFNAGWKGISLNAFFQGVQGQKFYVNGWGIDPFFQGTAPTTEFLNAWTPQNPSNTVPAVYQNGYSGVNGYSSTYFLRDASYLRLKNVNLSYTFPQQLIKAPWLKQFTLFVAGSNLLTWTKYQGADPERSGSGRYAQYPQVKIFSGGLKISL